MLTVQEEVQTRRYVFVLEEVHQVSPNRSPETHKLFLKEDDECGFFFPLLSFSKTLVTAHSNGCRQGFGKTILLGGSKFENRKKATATD